MNPLQTLRVALRALARNKMRSFLTTLGVVIGVSAVIAMVAIGDGAKARVEADLRRHGLQHAHRPPRLEHRRRRHGRLRLACPPLTWDDLQRHPDRGPHRARRRAAQLRTNAPGACREDAELEHPGPRDLAGVLPDPHLAGRAGHASSPSRTWTTGTKVAVLGQTVVDKLFGPNANPVGQTVRIKNIPFTVMGVLAKKGQSPWGQDYDDVVVRARSPPSSRRSRAA